MTLSAIAFPAASGSHPQYLLVALHGWGANAQDLAGLAPYLELDNCQMLFPDAPFHHPQVPGGRMWYGFPQNYDFRSPPDFERQSDLNQSRQCLTQWLISLKASTGVPLNQTVLAGFSQGGAMTLDVGTQLPLAGLMVLSGYLHAPVRPQHPNLPILIIHGRQDLVVPLALAQQARAELLTHNLAVEYYERNMGHEIQPEMLTQMKHFCEILWTK
ncbi:MAG: hypothetical protein HC873_00185 [Leptolyngbyaceae cyanobacterium SL_1_1]|nr:hypothetical protein [Leptolyngbyaceae cyanobacterium RM1_1_2]NJO08303.1 hypothetical protein [Leptolyngbyaceae cyanobacterium SL_1_1]